jgi:hypothetical protein
MIRRFPRQSAHRRSSTSRADRLREIAVNRVRPSVAPPARAIAFERSKVFLSVAQATTAVPLTAALVHSGVQQSSLRSSAAPASGYPAAHRMLSHSVTPSRPTLCCSRPLELCLAHPKRRRPAAAEHGVSAHPCTPGSCSHWQRSRASHARQSRRRSIRNCAPPLVMLPSIAAWFRCRSPPNLRWRVLTPRCLRTGRSSLHFSCKESTRRCGKASLWAAAGSL